MLPTTSPPLQLHSQSIAGSWKNDYGSVMNLNISGNQLSGTYQSSTGSVGKYEVTGYCLNTQPPAEKGQPVALAIEWHSLSDGSADPSWNWSSGLSGQLNMVDGSEVLTLSHLLIASSEFPDLTGPGNYVDKLTFHRTGTTTDLPPVVPSETPKLSDALSGRWVAEDGTVLALTVHPSSEHRFGCVQGRFLSTAGGAEVSGFTDINATTNTLNRQSVAITLAMEADNSTVSLCGSLDLEKGLLSLVTLTSVSTLTGNRYVQTQLGAMNLTRQR